MIISYYLAFFCCLFFTHYTKIVLSISLIVYLFHRAIFLSHNLSLKCKHHLVNWESTLDFRYTLNRQQIKVGGGELDKKVFEIFNNYITSIIAKKEFYPNTPKPSSRFRRLWYLCKMYFGEQSVFFKGKSLLDIDPTTFCSRAMRYFPYSFDGTGGSITVT